MDMFDPRYQLEAEEPTVGRRRSSLSHQQILHTLDALDHLACQLRLQRSRRRRQTVASR